MSSPDPPALGALLEKPRLKTLLERAASLRAIERELRAALAAPWAHALRVANLRGTVLVLHADHAGAATALRHRQKSLLEALNRRFGLKLDKLELKVRPAPRLGAI